jgi:hypothetical protein
MGMSDICGHTINRATGSPTLFGRVQPLFATASCTPRVAVLDLPARLHALSGFSDGSCGGAKTRAMQARCDIDTLGLRNAGTPTRAFAGSTEVRGASFGLVAALAGGGYLALARAGVIGGIGPADLTLLRFGLAGTLLSPVLFRHCMRDLAGVGWRRGLAGPPFALLQTGGFVFAPLAHGVVIMPAVVTTVAMLLAFVALPERINATQLAGTGVVLLGLALTGADGLVSGTANN